jgi:uncharacterized protein YbjQ (UPF0145 family)
VGFFDPKCDSCGQKSTQVVPHRSGQQLCPPCTQKAEDHELQLAKILISTGDTDRPNEAVQVIMALQGGTDGWDSVFARTMRQLRNDALRLQCDAILNIRIEHRIYVNSEATWFSGTQFRQGIEYFAYGTAVRFI